MKSGLMQILSTCVCAGLLVTTAGCATWREECWEAPGRPEDRETRVNLAAPGVPSVASPLGQFILLRTSEGACAVRFTSACRGHDGSRPGMFCNGQETVRQSYEAYFQADGSEDMSRPNVTMHRGSVWSAQACGLPMHNGMSSNSMYGVSCGNASIRWAPWQTLHAVQRVPYGWSSGVPMQMAATTAQSPEQINFADPALKWVKWNGRSISEERPPNRRP